MTLLFTVREESGRTAGAQLDPDDPGTVMGVNVDGGSRRKSRRRRRSESWEVDITGKASHAGGAREGHLRHDGRAYWRGGGEKGGWFGKIVKPEGRGTSNIGSFGGRDGPPRATRPTSSPTTPL